MYSGFKKVLKQYNKIFIVLLCVLTVTSFYWVDKAVLAASPYYFRGYDTENITSNTFSYSGAHLDGTNIIMTDTTLGEAVGFISLDELGHDISTSIDLGGLEGLEGLEIDFSTTSVITEEGEAGAENDVPTVKIDFCGSNYSNVISTVNISKANNAVAGSEVLSSNVKMPFGTRSLIIYLDGANTNQSTANTVVFQNTSFIIHDQSAPSCDVNYNTSWTNSSVMVTVTASDTDSGLEGIYKDGTKVSSTSPYSFTVSSNSSYSIYSKDYAGKTSATQNVTINNIDKTAPLAPASIILSHDSWTNTDVSVTMPTLTQDSGSPVRYIYKIGSGSWQDLPNNYTVSDSGQYNISVAVADAAGNVSSSISDIIYIDKLAPVINNVSQTVSSGSCVITINAADLGLSGLKEMKYASGSHDTAYFSSGGTAFTGGTFTVSTGGIYTVYISDNAGNCITSEYTLNTAPSIVDLLDINMNEDEIYNVPLNITENETSLDKLSITATSSDETLIPNIIINQSLNEISLDIVPGTNLFGGPATITVEVEDEQGEKVTDSFNVTVLAVNDPPVALDDAGIVTNEDESIRIDVLANDSDIIDGDALSIIDAGTPLHGTASVVNGKIKYTPSADYNGTDSFTYIISDGNGGTASATVYISAIDVNDAPVATYDTAQTVEDSDVLIDVLANDNDIDMTTTDDEEISLISVTNGSHGTAAIENGKIRYTPNANWFGKDVFTYTISDKGGLTDTASVTVTILGINDLPQFAELNNEYTIDEDSIGASITFSISDAETENRSLMLQAVSLNENIIENGKVKIEGLADDSTSVTLKLTPVANAHGDVTIKLALGDGFTTVFKTITVHVANVNDNPVAYADEIKYDEDTPYVLIDTNNLISNDKDIDKDTLSFYGINTTTSVGSLEQVDADTYKYIPQTDYDGTDSFTYIVSDNNGGSAIGTCMLIANPINDAPIITIPQSEYTTNEDTAISNINLNIYDKETNASGLIVRAGSTDTDLVSADKISAINNNDGTCTLAIEPMPDANGTAVINVTVSDGSLSSTKSFNLKIHPVPDAPVAVDDSIYVPISGKQSFNALLNDRDADGDELNVVSFDDSALSGLLTYSDITKKFTYWASSGEHGKSTFTYTISDGDDTTENSTATVTLDVHNINHAPQISSIANQYTAEDSRADGISFKVSDEDYNDTILINISSDNTVLIPQDYENNIILTDNHDGTYSLSLVPTANKNGNVSITVTATDAAGSSDSATFTLCVYPDNDAPVAVDDEVSTNEDSSIGLNLLSNDSDPDGDNIGVNYIQAPSHGIISRSGSAYTYTPYGNYNGTEVLTYNVTDGQSTDTATVTITVMPINDAPIAWSDWREIPNEINQSAAISVLSNDYDPDGDTIHLYQIINQPSYGTAVINANGTVTYTRTSVSLNSNGADVFTYRIIDRDTATGDYSYDDATVYIGVEFTSSLYTYDKYVSCMEDAPAFTISLPISNPNNVNLELTINDTTSLGTLEVIDATHVQFTPAANAYGYASVTYTAQQVGGGETTGGEIIITVYPVNDEPVIDSAPQSVSCDEDSAGSTFNVLFHDIDCTDGDLVFYAYAQNTSSSCPVVLTSDININRQTGTATVTAKPVENANGNVNIIVGVSDGISQTERTVAMTVNPVDDYPYVSAINKTLYEDTNVTFGVILPNSDVDNDGLKVSIASGDGPAHGNAVVNADGTITYTPDEDYNGEDSLVFSVSDNTTAALTSKQTAYFTITPVNDQPVISNLNYYQSTKEDTPKDVTLTVTDVDNDLSSSSCYTITSSNEDLIQNSNISISQVSGYDMKIYLVPKANAYGSAIITIIASDGELSTKAEFKLTVQSVNDVPIANDDTANVDENVAASTGATSVTINVTGNDTDVEDASLKVSSISNISTGKVTNNNDGTLTYSVDGDYNGTATFDYTVMDSCGASDTASVTVTINAMNDPPKTTDDYKTTLEDTQAEISVLANDTDVEGDSLSLTDVYGCTHGTAEIDGENVVYTPNENYYGTDQFTYEVSDGHGGISTAIVHMTITSVNDAPIIEKHSSNSGDWTMDEDTTAQFNFTVSDPETPIENLIITIDSQNTTILKNTGIVLSTNAEGYKTITVTPEENANGTVSIEINATDGDLTSTKVFEITINPANDAPAVNPCSISTFEDVSFSGQLSSLDIDDESATYSKVTNPSHGTVEVNSNGSFTYTPEANYSGPDSFEVMADDGHFNNNTGNGTVYITVNPVNDKPDAADDNAAVTEDTPQAIDVLSNDTDVDLIYGDKITITSVSKPSHGTASVTDEKVTYTPDENYNGTDSFTYTISDSEGEVDSAAVNITITPVNDAPSNGDDISQTDEDTAVTIEVTKNDDIDLTTNPDTEKVNVISVDDPAHGTAVISDDKQNITYTPDANWFGTEVFNYTAQDAGGLTANFSVTVTVESVNDAPVIVQTLPNISTNEDTTSSAVTFTVTDVEDNDGDLHVAVTHNNSTLLPIVATTPDANGNCTFTVTPKANKNGTAQITVTVTDSNGATSAQTFTLTVNAVNDAPVAQNDSAETNENTQITIDVLLNDDVDLDNEGDTLTLLAISTPSYGSAAIVNNKLVYTPNANLANKTNYNDLITYLMKDSSGAESAANVIITVTPVNDAPIISSIADISGIDEDSIDGIGVLSFTVTDEEDDDDTLTVTVECSNTALFPLTNITITNPTGGTGVERTVQAIPAANMFGIANITLTVHDSQGRTSAETFTVTVNSVNDVPANGDDEFTVVEDVKTQLNVLDNDDVDYQTDPENITITSITAVPTHGTAEIASDGKSIYYTTEKDGNSPDSFTYRIYDAYGEGYYEFNVSITVTPVNDAPVVTLTEIDTYRVFEGVAQNDIPFTVTDVDNNVDTLTVTSVSTNPILVYKGLHFDTTTGTDRTIDVQPYLKWNGTTTITITAKDASGATGSDSFTFIVDSVNEAPVANNDTFTIPEDALTKVAVLANDTDGDIETNPDTEFIVVKSVVDNDPNATITVAEDGSGVNIQPNANYNGPVSFTYIANDAAGAESNSATVIVTVSQVNDAPIADDDSAVTDEDTPVTIDVLDGDTDIDQDAALNADPSAEILNISIDEADLIKPAHGTISVTADNKILYTPNANYNGTDSFEYNVDDGEALDKAVVSATIYQVNDNPVAVTDTASTSEDTAKTIDVLLNDTDVDTIAANNLDVLHYKADFSITSASVNSPAHGSVAIVDNKLVYTPNANYYGSDSITYTISDGHTGTATGTANITVISVNDLPVFDTTPATMNLTEDEENGVDNFSVSDIETAGASLNVTVVSSSNLTLIATSDVTITKGTDGDRTVTVNPKNNQNGSAIITLRVTDANSGTSTCTFTVNVAAVNDYPVGIDNNATINEDTSYTVAWTTLTSDVDIATNTDSIGVSIKAGDNASHGTATVTGNNIVYTPVANVNGTDSFTYTVTDSMGATDTGIITVTVSQVNDAPVADNDSAVTNEDTAVTIDVLNGDTDIDQDSSLNANPGAEVLSISIDEADLIKPAHGSISVADNKIVYTPDANYNGTDSFEYNADDGEALDKATVSVTIYQVNDNPVAVTDSASTNEDAAKTIDVLANDTDVDTIAADNLDVLHYKADFSITSASVNSPAHGSVAIVDNKLVYTPNANYYGSDSITYTISDGHTGSATGTANITIISVNDLPVFNTTPATMNLTEDEDNGVENFSVSDIETAGANLNVTVVSSSNPTLIATSDVTITKGIDGDRTVTVNPKNNQNGSTTIKLRVTDANSGTADYTFTVNVAAVNDAPVAQDNNATINEDTSYTVAWTTLTSDVDIVTNADSIGVSIKAGDNASRGTATVVGSNIIYTPFEHYNGADSFTYTVTDSMGATDTGVIYLTISQVNDSPVADDDSAVTNEDTAVTIDVLNGDTDIDQDEIKNADPTAEVLSISIDEADLIKPSHGTISVTEDNKILYTPYANYNGTDSFEYNADDGEALDKATVSVTIYQVNDNPVAVTDSATTGDEDPVSVNVLANDTDVDTIASLNQDVLHSTDTFSLVSYDFIGDAHGTLSNSAGTITYTSSLNFKGTQEISYTLSDGNGGSATGKLIVSVNEENDKPVAYDDAIVTDEDKQVTFNVLSNDTDQDIGDEISFVMFTQDTSSLPGSFSTNANGSITYTPDENYNGSFTLSYQMRDKAGLTDEADISITVAAVNDVPVAQDNNATINEDTSYTVAWTTLTSDVDIATNADSIGVSIKAADNASHGTATVTGNNIVYTPIANFNGTDSFTYTVTDSMGATDTGVIYLTISQVNDAPVADDDSAVTDEDTPVTIDVLNGDTDIDQDTSLNDNASAEVLSISIDEADLIKPAHGTISVTADNKILYTPDANYNGTDSFEYNADDGEALDKATVSVTIYQVNDNPVAVDDIAQTNDEDPVTIDVLLNDTDVDIQSDINVQQLHSRSDFELLSVDKPDNGTAEIKNGKIYYKPNDTFSGDDTFKYTMSDGHGASASADITVTVLSVNDPPATPVVLTPIDKEKYGTGSTIHVTWTGFDIDGDSLTYTLEYYDGQSWQVIEKGLADTQYDFVIPQVLKSITDLQFRVNASDAEYTSDYGYSGKLQVDKDAPKNIVVTMKTQDGKNYTAGTWTNQNVTITAISVQDASKVTFSYAIEDKAYSVASHLTLMEGVHTVYILATDEFGNQTVFGGYLVKIDKLAPAVPGIDITASDNGATIKLTLKSDPGGSGNNYLILPSNNQQSATGDIIYSVDKNGVYHFVIYDKAGNSTEFDATVDQITQGGGDVDVDLDEIAKIIDDADKVRLPGGEWSDTLTLKDAKPGTYTIEVMDKDGNISTMTITITDDEVAKGYWQASNSAVIWYISASALAIIILILLLAYNVKITAIANNGSGKESVLKTKKKLKMRKDEVIVALRQKDIEGSDYLKVELTKNFTKTMRGRALVVMLNKAEIIRTRIPDNAGGKFGFTIHKAKN